MKYIMQIMQQSLEYGKICYTYATNNSPLSERDNKVCSYLLKSILLTNRQKVK